MSLNCLSTSIKLSCLLHATWQAQIVNPILLKHQCLAYKTWALLASMLRMGLPGNKIWQLFVSIYLSLSASILLEQRDIKPRLSNQSNTSSRTRRLRDGKISLMTGHIQTNTKPNCTKLRTSRRCLSRSSWAKMTRFAQQLNLTNLQTNSLPW